MDSGILSLVVLAQYHHIAIDPEQIRRQFNISGCICTPEDILKAAKAIGFRAKQANVGLRGIRNDILPAIGITGNGRYFILARVSEGRDGMPPRVLIQEFSPTALLTVNAEELGRTWTGEAILLVPRSGFTLGRFRPSGNTRMFPLLVDF